jgi:hypothetical protein
MLSRNLGAEMTPLEKYRAERKDSWKALWLAELPGPALGHHYAGDWERGRFFFASEAVCAGFALWVQFTTAESNNRISTVQTLEGVLILLKLWEGLDAISAVDSYNHALREKYGVHDLSAFFGAEFKLLTVQI